MSLAGLFNQTIVIYDKSNYDKHGREVLGAGIEVDCRVQRLTDQRLLPNGQLIQLLAVVYLPADTDIDVDDKVTYDSVDYKVYSKSYAVDGQGDTNHIKVELTKWQAA
jgi:hypothetical protein